MAASAYSWKEFT